MVIADDTTADPRFADHPFVTGSPYIRFYAAARLAVDGHTLGALCAYDVKPRQVSTLQVQHLQALAAAVVQLLNQRAIANPVQI